MPIALGGLALLLLVLGASRKRTPVAPRKPDPPARVWPVAPYRGIISPFGASRDGGTRIHGGVDLGALPGDAILALADGVVLYPVSGFGIGAGLQAVAIAHADAQYIYAEIANILVKPGDTVRTGQRIATAAKNGDGNSMLHLEAWEKAPKGFVRWVAGARPPGLFDVQARLPPKPAQPMA